MKEVFHVKKQLSCCMALLLVLCFSLTAAYAQGTIEQGKYVVVTDGSTVEDNHFVDAVWNGLQAYQRENALPDGDIAIYISKSFDAADRASAVQKAVDNGAGVILLAGFFWDKSDVKLAKQYPGVCFLSFELTAKTYSSNMINVTFAEEISGFLAGYAAVTDGYRQLGFLGGTKKSAVIRYGYGFIQGANYAANALDTSVSMKYWYSGSYFPSDDIQARMEK